VCRRTTLELALVVRPFPRVSNKNKSAPSVASKIEHFRRRVQTMSDQNVATRVSKDYGLQDTPYKREEPRQQGA
jgi:hypothetical protein